MREVSLQYQGAEGVADGHETDFYDRKGTRAGLRARLTVIGP
jgi:hypothetical protein